MSKMIYSTTENSRILQRIKVNFCDAWSRWAWLRKQIKEFLGKNGHDPFPTRNPSKLPPAGVPYEPVRLEIRLARPGNTTDRLPRMFTYVNADLRAQSAIPQVWSSRGSTAPVGAPSASHLEGAYKPWVASHRTSPHSTENFVFLSIKSYKQNLPY